MNLSDSGVEMAAGPPPLPPGMVRAEPWGFWATVGMGLAITMTFLTVQSLVAVGLVFLLNRNEPGGMEAILENIEGLALDGRVLSISMLISFPVMVLGCLFFAHLRGGISHRDYFSFRPMRFVLWIFLPPLTIAFSLLAGWLLQLAGAPETNEWMLQIAQSAREHPFVLIGIVLLAPIAEELLFRGFVFRGLEASRAGIFGAIFLTALAWALIHGQYDVYGLAFIFSLGILLGVVRWKTQSIYGPIMIHLVNNAFAMFLVISQG